MTFQVYHLGVQVDLSSVFFSEASWTSMFSATPASADSVVWKKGKQSKASFGLLQSHLPKDFCGCSSFPELWETIPSPPCALHSEFHRLLLPSPPTSLSQVEDFYCVPPPMEDVVALVILSCPPQTWTSLIVWILTHIISLSSCMEMLSFSFFIPFLIIHIILFAFFSQC